jgi:hypothetical protein
VAAFALEKIVGKGAVCLEPTCKKAGRFQLHIFGTKMKRPGRMGGGSIDDMLCPVHAEEWADRWAELSKTPVEQPEAVAA